MPEQFSSWLAFSMCVYVVGMLALSLYAHRRVHDLEDFVLAGRNLSLPLAIGTLFATWFGAGTLLTSADEVKERGITAATLDPLGAGLCLIIAGLFFAGRMWRAKLTTLPELFERRFGVWPRRSAALLATLPYLGWIAAQFVALAGIMELFFGLPMNLGLVLVAFVGMLYTVIGGMWAVTLTDSVQVILIVLGVLVTLYCVLSRTGDGDVSVGLSTIVAKTGDTKLTMIPTETLAQFTGWLGILCAGALGNIPSQDIMQRVFAARSATIAKSACLIAGVLYIIIGAGPVILGLTGAVVLESSDGNVIPRLATLFLNPITALIFCLAILSAILSTIDSALLAPATMIAHDLVGTFKNESTRISWVRWAVVAVGTLSLGLAYLGESAYALLESGYEIGMISLMAPLVFALYTRHGGPIAINASMYGGILLWSIHLMMEWDYLGDMQALAIPNGIGCTAIAFVAFGFGLWFERKTCLLYTSPSPRD